MRGQGRRGARNPNTGRNSAVHQQIKALERRLTGHKTVPAANPPSFVQVPWNSWTFEREEQTTTDLQGFNITVADVINQIKGRLGFSDGADVRIKVQSGQIWCTASTLIYPDIEGAFYELAGEVSSLRQSVRSTQRDKGTLNMPARVGYAYPSADRREILGSDDAGLIIANGVASQAESRVTFRLQVLWNSNA